MQITYQLIQPTEAPQTSQLIKTHFDEFVAPEFSDEGKKEFQNYIAPENILARQQNNHFIFVAKLHEKLVGMIEIRNNNHLSLLFVDKEYQHQGISRALFEKAKEKILYESPKTKEISVNSSIYALKAYERLGFEATGEQTNFNGFTFVPMIYKAVLEK